MQFTRMLPALAIALAVVAAPAPAFAAKAAGTVSAATAETPDKLYERAEKLMEGDAPKAAQAVALLKKAAEGGHGYAKHKLAVILGDKDGKVYQRAEAMGWARRATKEHADDDFLSFISLLKLSELLRQDGTPAEVQESLALLEEHGKKDHFAILALARVWDAEDEDALPADPQKATTYFRQAAEAGNENAMNAMAERLLEGKGCAVDAPQAVEWYRKCAEKNDLTAMNGLIKAYRTGLPGVEKNPFAALGWARKVVALNVDSGYQTMGELYEEGVGVSVDYVQARNWYLKAWQKEIFNSPLRLARLHEKGLGGPVDRVAAYAFYKQCGFDEEANAAAERLYAGFDKATKKRADAMAKKVESKK